MRARRPNTIRNVRAWKAQDARPDDLRWTRADWWVLGVSAISWGVIGLLLWLEATQ